MALEDLNWLTSHHILKVAKLQGFGLLSKLAISETERRLARRLKIDTKNLDDKNIVKNQKNRSRKIYTIRKQLQKTTSHRINLKAVSDLEKKSITQMRKHNSQLIKEIKNIAKTITDSHNLIIYEQQQVTHDVATVITFLAHFVHILELDLKHSDVIRYIPMQYQRRLMLLVEAARNELINIELAAEESIVSEFDIQHFLKIKAESKMFKSKDIASLIYSRTVSNKRLHGKLNSLKQVVKQIHAIFLEIQKFGEKDIHGTFLPEISTMATHASVEFELLEQHMKQAIKTWPIKANKKSDIIHASKLVMKQLNSIKQKLKVETEQKKLNFKKSYHDMVELSYQSVVQGIDKQINDLNDVRNELLKNISTTEERAERFRLINKFLSEYYKKNKNMLVYLSQFTISQKFSPKDAKHKDQTFAKFTSCLESFEKHMGVFYDQMKARLHNTIDIIKNSLLLQQHLAIELNYLQQHTKKLYADLIKSHSQISKDETSKYKTKTHAKFAKQMQQKEHELKLLLDNLKNSIGKQISHLIKEIPDDEALELTFGKANVRELKNSGAIVANTLGEMAEMIGVHRRISAK
ncbi:hypothetical protein HOA92_06365 [archaeon]|nr:hypothetical protein [archaeon]